jgi:Domain of unknown function (DUF6430)
LILNIARDFKTRRFWRHAAVHFFSAVGVAASAVQLWQIVGSDWISDNRDAVTFSILSAAVAYSVVRSWPRPVEQHYNAPNVTIRVIEGDLFDQPENLVIGFCNTFDTASPNIIERESVQGQFLDRVFGGDVEQLDRELNQALADVSPIGRIAKSGKTVVYDIGTVAPIRYGRRIFFCVAYTSMDAQNVAMGSVDSLWRSLGSLWASILTHANGGAISIPVLGGGLSRISQVLPAQDSIRFTILSFMFAARRTRVCERLDIVVRKQDARKLDMLELQAFLKSLRAS